MPMVPRDFTRNVRNIVADVVADVEAFLGIESAPVVFTQQPTVSPLFGTAGEVTFTATPGVLSDGSAPTRAWLLGGTTLATTLSYAPPASVTGALAYQEYGPDGAVSNPISLTVNAQQGGGTPTPTPPGTPTPTPPSQEGLPAPTDSSLSLLSLRDTNPPMGERSALAIQSTKKDSTLSIVSGALPTGMALNSIGRAITGIVANTDSATFVVQETTPQGSRQTRMRIDPTAALVPAPSPTLTALSTTNEGADLGIFCVTGYANVNEPYAMLPAVKGRLHLPKTFAFAGDMYPGGSFNTATGEITGTPTGQGSFTGRITVSDSGGSLQSDPFTIIVGSAPVVINPSGDATGATDTAAVNAELSAGRSVRMGNGAPGAIWYFRRYGVDHAAIVQPGNTALYLPSREIRLVAGSNCQWWRNKNQYTQTRLDKNIAVVGPGRDLCLVNGRGMDQVRDVNGRVNQLFFCCSAENVMHRGYRGRGNMAVWHFIGTRLYQIRDASPDQEDYGGAVNHDGLDMGSGSSFVHIEGSPSGHVGDDVFSFYAKRAQLDSSMMAGLPWERGGDMTDIIVKDIKCEAGLENMFRLQCDSGSTFSRLFIHNVDNTLYTGTRILLNFGELRYLFNNTDPNPANFGHVYATGSTRGYDTLIKASSNFTNIYLKGITIDRSLAAIMTSPADSSKYGNIVVDGVTEAGSPLYHENGYLMQRSAGSANGLRIANWNTGGFNRFFFSLVNTRATVLRDIVMAEGPASMSSSPVSTGTMQNVTLAGAPLSPGTSGLSVVA